ncbi:type II toxin-antitoxin system CcdA family antitoxin [Gilvimarinus algae]|uniref:Type II toxin-antitoxin system CcdA family antitoxin n=1 Tax=Gilvimarinus algae TaxID=3058037 RepID=A0ABT8THT5_9GAMM|nr:type II toxin-antitoxin system CcdA family antitoxin [Gilvimarinus sp. SDUM040014]MDO3383481.1 type II toxin-antitoxin system CcdA family antitoxin [Gilvimarinus sp. SDUM040014]
MTSLFDTSAPKKATNLSINGDLLAKSRSLHINLSATLEQALKQELAKREAQKWQDEHKAAIKAYNEFVEKHGCFGDEFRNF